MGMASREKKVRKEKKWELMEHVVCLLEKSLRPDAKVERNQWLVNHKTIGVAKKPRKRQCDVVIRSGPPERESFWIVEVQKRGQKVKQGEYDGWVAKMDQVGAAGLIGVSEAGFPASAIEEAKTRGPRVLLLTLSQLEGKEWPVNIADQSAWISGLDIHMKNLHMVLVSSKPIATLAPAPIPARVFRRADTGAIVSSEWLAQDASSKYRHLYDHVEEGTIPGVLWEYVPRPELRLEMQHGSEWLAVRKIDFTSDLVLKRHRLPLTCAEYKPIDFGPILAYALTARGEIDGKDVNLRMILRRHPDGTMRCMVAQITGFAENASVGIGFITKKPGPEVPVTSPTA